MSIQPNAIDLVNQITENWGMPASYLFDTSILPTSDPEDEWPLPLLVALADLSAITKVAEDESKHERFTQARDMLTELCEERAERMGYEADDAGMRVGDVEVVIGRMGGRVMRREEVESVVARPSASTREVRGTERNADEQMVQGVRNTNDRSALSRPGRLSVAAGPTISPTTRRRGQTPAHLVRATTTPSSPTIPSPLARTPSPISDDASTRSPQYGDSSPLHTLYIPTSPRVRIASPTYYPGHPTLSPPSPALGIMPPTYNPRSPSPSTPTLAPTSPRPVAARSADKSQPTASPARSTATSARPIATPHSRRRDIMRDRRYRDLKITLESTELKIESVQLQIQARCIKRQIWDIEDEKENEEEEERQRKLLRV